MSYGVAFSSRFCCVNLPYILRLQFPYLFFFFFFFFFFFPPYVLPYIFLCFLHQFYYGLQVTCSYEAFRHDEAHGFLLACSSRLGIDAVVSMAWYLGALSLPYSSSINIVWRGFVSLVLGILRLSGSNVVSHCCVPWFGYGCFCTFASHLPLSGTSLANSFFQILDLWHLLPSLCSTGGYLMLLVCSPLFYHVHFYGTSRHPSQCRDSCLIKCAGNRNIGNVIFNLKWISIYLPAYLIHTLPPSPLFMCLANWNEVFWGEGVGLPSGGVGKWYG